MVLAIDFRRQARVCVRLAEECEDRHLAERLRLMAADLTGKADAIEELPTERLRRTTPLWRLSEQTQPLSVTGRHFTGHTVTRSHLEGDRPNMTRILLFAMAIRAALPSPAAAQDIRGMEICTAEKQMERRTSCLQANVEYLQQALNKLIRETEKKMAAADHDLAVARAEIAALKSTVDKLTRDLAKTKGNAPDGKK